jgi:drug/metabolite transporter (DMT)-like permease
MSRLHSGRLEEAAEISAASCLPAPSLSFGHMSTSTMTMRRYLILGVVALASAFGDTFLAVGMKRLRPVSFSHPGELLSALRTPWVLGGILLLLVFFASYLTALSWADLTFVLPATSLAYVAIALLSRFWLHEHITPARWLGIALITAGVGFVTQGPAYTPRHASDHA